MTEKKRRECLDGGGGPKPALRIKEKTVKDRERIALHAKSGYNVISSAKAVIFMTEVAAALIRDGDRFMICQRPAHKARGLLWEFVGGKAEPGETREQALIRECREELAVTVSVGEVFMDVVHEYPDLLVHLTLFNAVITEGAPQKLEHNDIRWITVEEIPNYHFCPADDEILKKLMGR